jgi:photosystem II stability/assembly factor-like uncharacterized protein
MRRSLRSVAIVGVMGVLSLPVTASAAPPPWHAQNSHLATTLKGIEFSDSCHGWAVGEPTETSAPGTATPIVATRNGGRTWFSQTSGLQDTTLNRVDFVDNSHGWAAGEPFETAGNPSAPGTPTLIATANGGRTWVNQTANLTSLIDTSLENDIEGLSFVSRTEGWLAVSSYGSADTGAILHTADGGATFTAQTIPDPTSPVADVSFVNSSSGWAVNDKGDILTTTDGGANWAVQNSTGINGLEAITFHDPMHGVAVGDGGVIWMTKDGGTTWNPGVIAAPFGTYDNVTLTDVAFPTAGLVAISTEPVSGNRSVLVSPNGGAVFYPQSSGTTNTLNSVAYARGTKNGWVSGENGTIRTNHTPAC